MIRKISLLLVLLTFFAKSQIDSVCFEEVKPKGYVRVELCSLKIPENVEMCIKKKLENSQCNLIKKDSSEKFVTLMSVWNDNKWLKSEKGYDECMKGNCTLLIYLTDIIEIEFLKNRRELYWDYVGYFNIGIDSFYVKDCRYDSSGIDRYFFKHAYKRKKVNLYKTENMFFTYTNECKEITVPILVNSSELRSDTGWPYILIEIEKGEVKKCELNCFLKSCLHGVKIKDTKNRKY